MPSCGDQAGRRVSARLGLLGAEPEKTDVWSTMRSASSTVVGSSLATRSTSRLHNRSSMRSLLASSTPAGVSGKVTVILALPFLSDYGFPATVPGDRRG
jgi:hypothetical protein